MTDGYRAPLREGKSKHWIGVDLDGTLARWDADTEEEAKVAIETIGEPIAPMVELVKYWREHGQEVRIFTARVAYERPFGSPNKQSKMIREWSRKHLGEELPVTCVKDPNMIALYDDRAVRVMHNTGLLYMEINGAIAVV